VSVTPLFPCPRQSCRSHPLYAIAMNQWQIKYGLGTLHSCQDAGNRKVTTSDCQYSSRTLIPGSCLATGTNWGDVRFSNAPLRFVQGNNNVSLAHRGCFIKLNLPNLGRSFVIILHKLVSVKKGARSLVSNSYRLRRSELYYPTKLLDWSNVRTIARVCGYCQAA
jgi:hypothetical protein